MSLYSDRNQNLLLFLFILEMDLSCRFYSHNPIFCAKKTILYALDAWQVKSDSLL